jgi:hypothetical protein
VRHQARSRDEHVELGSSGVVDRPAAEERMPASIKGYPLGMGYQVVCCDSWEYFATLI